MRFFHLTRSPKGICIALTFSLGLFLSPSSSMAGNVLIGDTIKTNTPAKEVRVYNTERLSTPKPIIDGKLDDPCWKTGTWTTDFIQWIATEGGKPSQATYVKVLY